MEPLPDLFLIDIPLPGIDGTEFVKRAHARHGHCPCLRLLGHSSSEYVVAARKAAARGFVSKSDPELLMSVITMVPASEQYWP